MLSQTLIQLFDLNPKDADIYLDLLGHGDSVASTISHRTQIERTSVYSTLKRLTKKGLVSYHFENEVQHFTAVDPKTLKRLLDQEMTEAKAKSEEFYELLPQLTNLINKKTSSPLVQFFEGAEGVINLYELMLSTSTNHSAFLTVENLPPAIKPYLTQDYIQNKIKKGVTSRVLVSESVRAKRYKELDPTGNRESKLVPKEFLPFETEVIIGEKDLAIIDLKDRFFGIYLKSRSIRNTLQALFETLWTLMPESR